MSLPWTSWIPFTTARQVRRLLSAKPPMRQLAFRGLRQQLCPQGKIQSRAPVRAVPLLIRCLADASPEAQVLVLELLAEVAKAPSWLDVHQHSSMFTSLRPTAPFQRRLGQQQSWVEKTREALEHVPFERLLGDGPQVRLYTGYLLWFMPSATCRHAARLWKEVQRDDYPLLSFVLLVALGVPETERIGSLRRLEEWVVRAPSALGRLGAAMVLAWTLRERAPQAVLDCFQWVFEHPESIRAEYEPNPWHGDLLGDTALVAANLGFAKAQGLLPHLCRALTQTANPYAAQDLTEALLYLVAGQDHPRVEQALRAIAESEAAWTYNADLMSILGRFGLQQDRAGLRHMLGFAEEPMSAKDVVLQATDYSGPPIPFVVSRSPLAPSASGP